MGLMINKLLLIDYSASKKLGNGRKGTNIVEGVLFLFLIRIWFLNQIIISILAGIFNITNMAILASAVMINGLLTFYGLKKTVMKIVKKNKFSLVEKKLPVSKKKKYLFISLITLVFAFVLMFYSHHLFIPRV